MDKTCPSCGPPSAGRFCSHCGAVLGVVAGASVSTRAAPNLGDKAKAISYAHAVPAGFVVWVNSYPGPSHSGWSPTAPLTAQLFDKNTDVRLASGLEAQYIVAEAQGVSAANIDFVNSRRAVGGQAPLTATATASEYLDAPRGQRRRDFFLDGHRLGDLRRYKKLYAVDQFPTGQHPVAQWGNYDLGTCCVPSLAERLGNPAY